MKISIVQCNLFFGNVDKNFKNIEAKIREAAESKADTVVLPEMWNTSFFPENVKELADLEGIRTKKFLSNLSQELENNIVGGSVANLIDGNLYNTCYVYNRKGEEIATYNKVHLFSPSGEDKVFIKGNKLSTFELDGIKCGVAICYDVRFVEWIRKYALEDIKIMFLPAAWPEVRNMHWDILNRARAIENQMFMVNVNSVGESPNMKFGGRSAIIDPWGEYILSPDDKDEIKFGEIDLSIIENIRDSINVFRDRREDFY